MWIEENSIVQYTQHRKRFHKIVISSLASGSPSNFGQHYSSSAISIAAGGGA